MLAFVGLVLGVASLVASMAVVSGFESTLRASMTDVTSHVQVLKRAYKKDDWTELRDKIKALEPTLKAAARFVFLEAVVAHQGTTEGVVIQGVDSDQYAKTLNLEGRLLSGKIDFAVDENGLSQVMIGKGLARKLQVSVGDSFKLVVPIAEDMNPAKFRRHLVELKVAGVLDLGKNDFNERFILADLKTAQAAGELGDQSYAGLFLKFDDADKARISGARLAQSLGAAYWVRDWHEVNETLFQAVRIERVVIFFVVFIIVIVAAFNVSSTLFVSVIRRFADIAILKSIGLSESKVRIVFTLQGLIIGFVAVLVGTFLGLLLCYAFMWGQTHLGLIDGSVYRVDKIDFEIRFLDWLAILAATLFICFIATLGPAIRGSKLSPVEGLRYG